MIVFFSGGKLIETVPGSKRGIFINMDASFNFNDSLKNVDTYSPILKVSKQQFDRMGYMLIILKILLSFFSQFVKVSKPFLICLSSRSSSPCSFNSFRAMLTSGNNS